MPAQRSPWDVRLASRRSASEGPRRLRLRRRQRPSYSDIHDCATSRRRLGWACRSTLLTATANSISPASQPSTGPVPVGPRGRGRSRHLALFAAMAAIAHLVENARQTWAPFTCGPRSGPRHEWPPWSPRSSLPPAMLRRLGGHIAANSGQTPTFCRPRQPPPALPRSSPA